MSRTSASQGSVKEVPVRTQLTRVAAPLRQQMTARLREALLGSEYEPGCRLVEKGLCDRYGVSRTVVREALRQLEAEGLVTMVPNRGPVVAVLTQQEAVALFEVRAALEALAAELFAQRATAVQRRRLQSAALGIKKAFRSGGPADWLLAKDEFYEAMFSGAHNDVIHTTVLGLHARVQILRRLSLAVPGRQPVTLAEIQAICTAAVGGDSKAAAEAARRHVEQAASVALEQLSRNLSAAGRTES